MSPRVISHLLGIPASATLITFCAFLPFLPGRYDGLAVTLSGMSQVFGVTGLVLVPIGAAWLIYEARRGSDKNASYYFATGNMQLSRAPN